MLMKYQNHNLETYQTLKCKNKFNFFCYLKNLYLKKYFRKISKELKKEMKDIMEILENLSI